MTEKLLFWTMSQNNSGGIFDHVPEKGIGYCVAVQASSEDEAWLRWAKILESYDASYDCPCCGDRWSSSYWDSEAKEQPEQYGRPLTGGWSLPSYVHYIDGRIEAVQPEPVE